MEVIFIDERKPWMITEDREWACFSRCPFYKKCSTRMGHDCKRLGGGYIPKLRG